jgi:N-acyl homoserine lactone hydrolase
MATSKDPITRVSVISTGSVSIRPEHVGPTWKNLYVWLFTSRRWTAPRPINVYVIEHRDGLVLFDTGQDRASVTDREYFPSGFNGLIYSRLARFAIGPDDTLTAGLAALGHQVDDVRTAVISHLHQDHIGGLPVLGHARIVIHRDEWDALSKPLPEARGFLRTHIDLPGLNWDRIDPSAVSDPTLAPFTHGHDLFGDGAIIILPTPGHTDGSLSMLVRRPEHAPLLMVGDLTYDADLLAGGKLPGVGDKRQMRDSVAKINALRDAMPDLAVLPAHDPGAAARLDAALRPRTARASNAPE